MSLEGSIKGGLDLAGSKLLEGVVIQDVKIWANGGVVDFQERVGVVAFSEEFHLIGGGELNSSELGIVSGGVLNADVLNCH